MKFLVVMSKHYFMVKVMNFFQSFINKTIVVLVTWEMLLLPKLQPLSSTKSEQYVLLSVNHFIALLFHCIKKLKNGWSKLILNDCFLVDKNLDQMEKVNLAMVFNRADIARNNIFIAGVENGLKWTVKYHCFFLLVKPG